MKAFPFEHHRSIKPKKESHRITLSGKELVLICCSIFQSHYIYFASLNYGKDKQLINTIEGERWTAHVNSTDVFSVLLLRSSLGHDKLRVVFINLLHTNSRLVFRFFLGNSYPLFRLFFNLRMIIVVTRFGFLKKFEVFFVALELHSGSGSIAKHS